MGDCRRAEDVTHLEGYLDCVKGLPLDLQRNLALVRLLDKECKDVRGTLDGSCDDMLKQAEADDFQPSVETLKEIRAQQKEAYGLATEKIAVIEETEAIIQSFMERLDEDIEKFKNDLGDLVPPDEEEKAAPSSSSSSSSSTSSSSSSHLSLREQQRNARAEQAERAERERIAAANANAAAEAAEHHQQLSHTNTNANSNANANASHSHGGAHAAATAHGHAHPQAHTHAHAHQPIQQPPHLSHQHGHAQHTGPNGMPAPVSRHPSSTQKTSSSRR
jgi:hypothetical protein